MNRREYKKVVDEILYHPLIQYCSKDCQVAKHSYNMQENQNKMYVHCFLSYRL